jgi:hypothetical protein
MITVAELKEMYDNKEIEKFVYPNQLDHFYYIRIDKQLPHSINEEIMQRNKLKFTFSEWWDVYNGRLSRLKTLYKNLKFEDVVIFISLEECINYGL